METLIIRYLSGEATSEEAKALFEWIALSRENRDYYNGFKKTAELSTAHLKRESQPLSDIDINEEWNVFQRKVKQTDKNPVVPLYPSRPLSVSMKVAAALAVVLISGFVVTWFLSKNNEVVYQTETNTLAVTLPDGSKVILNQNSRLSYSSLFGKEKRIVTIKGEAFFDVIHDDKKSFIVDAGRTRVEDVGTSFDVRSYPDDEKVEVTVQSGEVKFSVPEDGKELNLKAGEKALFLKASKQITSLIPDANFLSWNTQRIIFSGSDLKTVIETINNTYHARISIAADVPSSCQVTVTFDHQSLESVLHVLETTLNLTIKKTGDKIEIIHAGC